MASLNSLLAGKSTQEKLPTIYNPSIVFRSTPFLLNQCVYVWKHNAQLQIQNFIRVTWGGWNLASLLTGEQWLWTLEERFWSGSFDLVKRRSGVMKLIQWKNRYSVSRTWRLMKTWILAGHVTHTEKLYVYDTASYPEIPPQQLFWKPRRWLTNITCIWRSTALKWWNGSGSGYLRTRQCVLCSFKMVTHSSYTCEDTRELFWLGALQ